MVYSEDITEERAHKSKLYSYQKTMFRYKYAKKFFKKEKILDIGCGIGYGTLLFEDFDIIGIDYHKGAINLAKKVNPLASFKLMKVPPLKFTSNSFDNVICAEFIEHIHPKEANKLISEIYRVLKKGGIFFLSTPNLLNREKIFKCHKKEYTPKEIISLLKKYNFKIIHRGGMVIPFLFKIKKILPHKLNKSFLGIASKSKTQEDTKIKKSFKGKIFKKIFSIAVAIMIYAGYLFPKKAEYQIWVTQKY